MWSDNDIDKAFQRLNPPEPEPAPFPLDAWLRLENELDKEEVARTVRRKMWRFFAAEVLIVALVGLGWLLWKPADAVAPAASRVAASGTTRPKESQQFSASTAAQPTVAARPHGATNASAVSPAGLSAAAVNSVPTANAAAGAAKPGLAPVAARAASSTQGTALESRKSVLGVAVATPRFNSASAHDGAEHRTSRLPLAAAIPSKSRKDRRLAEQQAQRSHQSNGSVVAARFHSRASSAVATSEAPATALSATNSTRSETWKNPQPEAHISDEADGNSATVTPLAAAELDPKPSPVASDNAALVPQPVSLPTAALALPAPLTPVAETKLTTAAPEPRFFIGLVGAPDVSTVRFVSVERPLLNMGLTLEYRFTNRLRVSTGLLRANKEYYARREDYDWTNYPRAQTRTFSWVEGKCIVLDVPLNLRYDAVVRDNARWFGTAGLSSFFMHRENYSYDYLEGGDYKLWEMPGLVNANQHLFSVLNLSAGYERGLGQHWRLQAEPYVKVPLGGVGAGKVKLTSAGVFLGVKYGF